MPACKPASETGVVKQVKTEDTLVQQAANSCRQRIQEAAGNHAANAKQLQEAKVLDMDQVTKREQLETKREVVRKYLASNEALKSLLAHEEAAFTEELTKLNVPQAKIEPALKAFQSGIPGKAVVIRMREADQRIGNSLLGALDFLAEIWGEWNYNKEYMQVQFSPPGALKKYNDFMEAIEAATREQQELREELKAAENPGR